MKKNLTIAIALGTVVALSVMASGQGYIGEDVPDGGSISGTIKYNGTAPAPKKLTVDKDVAVCGRQEKTAEDLLVGANGGIKNVVVSITNIGRGKKLVLPNKPIQIDQLDCQFTPHIVLVPANTKMEVLNSDGILHNIHTYSVKNPPLNKAQPKFMKKMELTFAQPEIVKVTCDAHNWMRAFIVVQGHPYHALTDANGNFKIDNVPPGTYTLEFWQESLGKQTQEVTVAAGKELPVNMTMGPKK